MRTDQLQPLVDVEASLRTFESGTFEQRSDGVTTWKLLADLDRYRHIIETTKPDLVIETGTKFGGSALWFEAQGVDVITIDVDDRSSVLAQCRGQRITWVTGDAIADSTADFVRRCAAGRRTMVSLDSEHAAPHVLQEIALYGPMVSQGCYLVVEDGIFDLAPEPLKARGGQRIPTEGGPLVAIEQALLGQAGWTRDEDVERMHTVSHHPAGWWRRD